MLVVAGHRGHQGGYAGFPLYVVLEGFPVAPSLARPFVSVVPNSVQESDVVVDRGGCEEAGVDCKWVVGRRLIGKEDSLLELLAPGGRLALALLPPLRVPGFVGPVSVLVRSFPCRIFYQVDLHRDWCYGPLPLASGYSLQEHHLFNVWD